MNISTGGPHILFFERDQQLAALLTSEFQLAGYECHAARTAVEVFDTIARFPVRILLVNLAQAAAGRREFWVALDTQRRGRGVQVFTFLCSNLAGYGPRDTDERPQTQAIDIEIDGMLGLMNLVDVIRVYVSGTSSSIGASTQPRLVKVSPSPTTPVLTMPTSMPVQTNMNDMTYRTGSIADSPSYQTPRTGALAAPAAQTLSPTINQQSYSEKIRAVLYPTQRPTNTQATTVNTQRVQSVKEVTRPVTYSFDALQQVLQNELQSMQSAQENFATQQYDTGDTTLQRLAYSSPRPARESGLDQLSRFLEERSMPKEQIVPPINYPSSSQIAPSTRAMNTQPLRASPIEDLPLDHEPNSVATSDVMRCPDGVGRANYGQYVSGDQTQTNQPPATQAPPLASISTLRAPIAQTVQAAETTRATMPIPAVMPLQKAPVFVAEPVVTERISAPPIQQVQEVQAVQQTVKEIPVERDDDERVYEEKRTDPLPYSPSVEDEVDSTRMTQTSMQQEHMSMQDSLKEKDFSEVAISSNSAMLLDIVQSLPLMPSPPPQTPTPSQAVNGRTMRTLGSVLLEGHLVPQSRLEVAQNIQRMLRGVDLNYQLGEILLMFKLLTPDQLLAASLVSYGMISTQQISALGRIRQELHSIGLEYDLESLLILFRMLTPEQLREVRAGWQG